MAGPCNGLYSDIKNTVKTFNIIEKMIEKIILIGCQRTAQLDSILAYIYNLLYILYI